MFRENYPEYEKLLQQQRQTWNQFSGGWKKWDDLLMSSVMPVADGLVETLDLKGNEIVLDVASGTGEPGLSLCDKLPQGHVYGTDLSEKMVAVAIENSQRRALGNYTGLAANALELPFKNNHFDHVICRFGIMFFPDMMAGLKEMKRVLKPGGVLSVAVWAAPNLNPFISIMGSVVRQKLNLPSAPKDSPGIFRCAEPGLSGNLLRAAGVKDVSEKSICGVAGFDSAEQYWDVMSDIAGPIMQALRKATSHVVLDVRNDVIEKAGEFTNNGQMEAGWEAIIASGVKPMD